MGVYYPKQNFQSGVIRLWRNCGIALIVFALGFLHFITHADETDIHQEIMEKKDKTGNVVSRVEKTFRGHALIMEADFLRNRNGAMTIDSRTFYVDGYAAMVENKSNPTNAILNNLTILRISTNFAQSDVEMFTREADGSAKPAPTQELENYKKEMTESFVAFQVIGGGATNRIKDTIVSPDKRLKAIVFSRDYGALGAFNRQIVVIENSQPFLEYDPDKILMCVTADGNASKYLSEVKAFWTSTNEIHIKYPIGKTMSGPRLVTTNSPSQKIKVVYEGFDVK